MKATSLSAREKALQKWCDVVNQICSILDETTLVNESKWNLPCYTFESANVAIIQPFKKFVGLMFFKGALLKDAKKLLKKNGPHSRHGCRFEFATVADVKKNKAAVKAYVKEAIQLEKAGAKVKPTATKEKLPAELVKAFKSDIALKKAFQSLTPGRQRAYAIFISSAKQSETRVARIEKHRKRILRGLGIHD